MLWLNWRARITAGVDHDETSGGSLTGDCLAEHLAEAAFRVWRMFPNLTLEPRPIH